MQFPFTRHGQSLFMMHDYSYDLFSYEDMKGMKGLGGLDNEPIPVQGNTSMGLHA